MSFLEQILKVLEELDNRRLRGSKDYYRIVLYSDRSGYFKGPDSKELLNFTDLETALQKIKSYKELMYPGED